MAKLMHSHKLRRLLFDPLTQFLLAGTLVFVGYSAFLEPPAAASIVLREAEIDEFIRDHRARFGAEPSTEQLSAFQESWVNEEVLFREGLRLGLTENDPMVRQRVITKMQLLLSDQAGKNTEVNDEVLREFLAQRLDDYQTPRKYRFETATFDAVPGGSSLNGRTYALMVAQALNNGAAPNKVGARYETHTGKSAGVVRALWGEEFLAVLEKAKSGSGWTAADSKRGLLLVRLDDVRQPELPAFERLRSRLLIDWKRAQIGQSVRQKTLQLRSKYHIDRQGSAET